jgi:RNA polymerase sporulation-specific sigma factor
MPQSRKTVVERLKKQADPEVLYYIELVEKIRDEQTKPEARNLAFQSVVDGLESKIKKIAGKFKIPGDSFEDVYQESLVALRFKAIKDYDITRGSGEGPAPFDRFALLCIRRHLATKLKTSHQHKHRVMTVSKSLDQDRSSDNEDLSIVNILESSDSDILTKLQDNEQYKLLINRLLTRLSKFEKLVFYLYANGYTYDEISSLINRKYPQKDNVDVKSVDNALSRIKHKGDSIFMRLDPEGWQRAMEQRLKDKSK